MSVPPALVVDASVAAKWYLNDEDGTEKATRLLTLYRAGRTNLAAPAFIRYEIANVLRSALLRGRIDEERARVQLSLFLEFDIHARSDADSLVVAAQQIALYVGASMYDATYIAYAELRGFDLVTDDRRLSELALAYGISAYLLSELDLS